MHENAQNCSDYKLPDEISTHNEKPREDTPHAVENAGKDDKQKDDELSIEFGPLKVRSKRVTEKVLMAIIVVLGFIFLITNGNYAYLSVQQSW
jgi:hypothetical protein